MTADFDLERFVEAQDRTYPAALAELRSARKRGHWMWFVFPQLRGLGHSPTAQAYGIASVSEARAYLAHPVLGQRLAECSAAMLSVSDRSADEILGAVDAMKLRSSMTLFATADPALPVFGEVLERYFGGEPDPMTLGMLGLS